MKTKITLTLMAFNLLTIPAWAEEKLDGNTGAAAGIGVGVGVAAGAAASVATIPSDPYPLGNGRWVNEDKLKLRLVNEDIEDARRALFDLEDKKSDFLRRKLPADLVKKRAEIEAYEKASSKHSAAEINVRNAKAVLELSSFVQSFSAKNRLNAAERALREEEAKFNRMTKPAALTADERALIDTTENLWVKQSPDYQEERYKLRNRLGLRYVDEYGDEIYSHEHPRGGSFIDKRAHLEGKLAKRAQTRNIRLGVAGVAAAAAFGTVKLTGAFGEPRVINSRDFVKRQKVAPVVDAARSPAAEETSLSATGE